jgi:glc operon protein GlcG
MRRTVLTSLLLGTAMLAGSQLRAQQPAPPNLDAIPEKMPFNNPYGPPIGAQKAQSLIQAAAAEASKRDWAMNIAVVDSGRNLVSFLRMDGAQLASIPISEHKARVAVRYRRPTKALEDGVQKADLKYLLTLDDVIASRGGIPLIEDGKIIGAVVVPAVPDRKMRRPAWPPRLSADRLRIRCRSHVDDDVVFFHRDLERLDHIGAFQQLAAGLDRDRVLAHIGVVGIAIGLPGAHVELPPVPRAFEQFALPREPILARLIGEREPDKLAAAERGALMRTFVGKGEKLALDVEDADLAPLDGDKLARAGGDLTHARNDVPGHLLLQSVKRLGVAGEEFCAHRLLESRLEHVAWVVEIPVRVVGREHQPIPSDPTHDLEQILRLVRLVDRLRREPEMLADVF